MRYWGSSDSAHTHGPCEHCDEILDALRREEAENERLWKALTTCEKAIGAPIAHPLAQAAFRACRDARDAE